MEAPQQGEAGLAFQEEGQPIPLPEMNIGIGDAHNHHRMSQNEPEGQREQGIPDEMGSAQLPLADPGGRAESNKSPRQGMRFCIYSFSYQYGMLSNQMLHDKQRRHQV